MMWVSAALQGAHCSCGTNTSAKGLTSTSARSPRGPPSPWAGTPTRASPIKKHMDAMVGARGKWGSAARKALPSLRHSHAAFGRSLDAVPPSPLASPINKHQLAGRGKWGAARKVLPSLGHAAFRRSLDATTTQVSWMLIVMMMMDMRPLLCKDEQLTMPRSIQGSEGACQQGIAGKPTARSARRTRVAFGGSYTARSPHAAREQFVRVAQTAHAMTARPSVAAASSSNPSALSRITKCSTAIERAWPEPVQSAQDPVHLPKVCVCV